MVKEGQPEPGYLPIGSITSAHGIRGEVKVEILTDFPERFRTGARLFIGSETEARPVEVTAVRPHQHGLLVKFAHIPDRNAAELAAGQLILIPTGDRMPLAEHENYTHELVGLGVETTDGRSLGEITDILATGANDVYVVMGTEGEVLIPALREVVLNVDLAAGRMLVELPDGLLG